MVKSSDKPNSHRRQTRSGLAAVGGATGCRRSARLSHHYGAADAQCGTLKTRPRQRRGTKKRGEIAARGCRAKKRGRRVIFTAGTSNTAEEEVKEYRQRRGIIVQGRHVPNPFRNFGDTGFPENVIQELSKAGFVRPTPIQAQVWPIALKGHDLIGIAEPGSGKKLAYLMAAIDHVKSQPKLSRGDGPIVLVLAPTTEDCEQIQQEYTTCCAASNIKALCGHPFVDEESFLKSGVGILIATPVDLSTMLELGLTNLQRVTLLVLDGVDQILDMDSEPEIQEIVSQIRPDCQKLFLSTTWPKEVDKLARPFLRNTCKVEIGFPVLKATQSIDQMVDVVNEDEKYSRLVRLLDDIACGSRILIFVDIKKGCESCDMIASRLRMEGRKTESVHEGKSRAERGQIVSKFQDGRIDIMIATDAGAWGIDVKDMKYVINYDFPGSLDEYVYRIDHCGSAGTNGTAYTFFTAANARFAKPLTILLEEAGQKVSPELAAMGRDVPNPGRTHIRLDCRLAEANRREKRVGAGHFSPMYLHCHETNMCAKFSVDDVKEKENLQLHLVRVVEAYKFRNCVPVTNTYLTFEAADAVACEVKIYRAIIMETRIGLETLLFGHVNADGDLVELIDSTKNVGYRVYNIWPDSRREDVWKY